MGLKSRLSPAAAQLRQIYAASSFVSTVPVGYLSRLLAVQWLGQAQCQQLRALWAHTQGGRGGVLADSLCSHGRPRYWTLADLHWWFCEPSAWGTSGPIAWVPKAEAGLRAVPTKVYLVSSHKAWQVTSQSTLPSGQLLQRNTQWLLFQQRCCSPTYLTLQLRTEIGGFHFDNWGAHPAHNSTVTTIEQKVQCRLWLPQYQSHPLSRGKQPLYLWKDMTGIHTKKSPYTKNIRLTQATQAWSHIKTVLQDHSR